MNDTTIPNSTPDLYEDRQQTDQITVIDHPEHQVAGIPAADQPLRVRRGELIRTSDDMPLADPMVVRTRLGKYTSISGSLVRTSEFDERFYFNGRLGVFYSRESTLLKVWAPTAEEVTLEIWESADPGSSLIQRLPMHQSDVGVWELELAGDCHLVAYTYHLAFADGTEHSTVDPYARAVGLNGKKGVILDPESVHIEGFYRMAPFTHPVDAVIYELHIRDFTVDPESGVSQPGRFLGAVESGTVNSNGSPTGLDHLKSLGVTHVQILPMYDFASVDEARAQFQYNWGYDPQNFNAPEGSYSTDPSDPIARIRELKSMIKAFHDAGIRVIMDVVYNHVYEVSDHPLHKTAPGYFFRYDRKGTLSNGTGVGNDTASERRMMRKFMLDSIRYWLEEFHLDGFRFDLMGIHDVDTMNEIRRLMDTIDPSILLLGEGWNLSTELPEGDKAWQGNARKMPRIGHFNDSLRDAVKGSTFQLQEKGFVSGHHRDQRIVADDLFGRIDSRIYFGPDQVIQYVEAHDNHTLFDKLCLSDPSDSAETRIRRHTLATSLVLLAQGVPFLHGGQEFLRTKQGVENSYRSGDQINRFDWLRPDQYRDAVEYVKGLIALRRSQRLLRLRSADEIRNSLHLLQARGGVICWHLADQKEELLILVNGNDASHRGTVIQGDWEVLVRQMKVLPAPVKVHLNRDHYQIPALSAVVLHRNRS